VEALFTIELIEETAAAAIAANESPVIPTGMMFLISQGYASSDLPSSVPIAKTAIPGITTSSGTRSLRYPAKATPSCASLRLFAASPFWIINWLNPQKLRLVSHIDPIITPRPGRSENASFNPPFPSGAKRVPFSIIIWNFWGAFCSSSLKPAITPLPSLRVFKASAVVIRPPIISTATFTISVHATAFIPPQREYKAEKAANPITP